MASGNLERDFNRCEEIHIVKIEDNKNNLPFFIEKLSKCNQTKHMHEFIQIIYMCKGKLKHVVNNNVFNVYSGDIFIIPPFVPHYFIDSYEEKFEMIEFEFVPEFVNEKFSNILSESNKDGGFMDFAYLEPFLVAEHEVKPRLNLTGSVRMEIENILNEVLFEYEQRDADFELAIKALLLKLLVIVGREYKKTTKDTEFENILSRHRDALYRAIVFINENYQKDITIDDVSKVAMLSQSYFRYLFKQITQKTFTEYINGLRIAKAIELLKTRPEMKIIDISMEVGFNNVNHFNRTFRSETGITPMQVRRGII